MQWEIEGSIGGWGGGGSRGRDVAIAGVAQTQLQKNRNDMVLFTINEMMVSGICASPLCKGLYYSCHDLKKTKGTYVHFLNQEKGLDQQTDFVL